MKNLLITASAFFLVYFSISTGGIHEESFSLAVALIGSVACLLITSIIVPAVLFLLAPISDYFEVKIDGLSLSEKNKSHLKLAFCIPKLKTSK